IQVADRDREWVFAGDVVRSVRESPVTVREQHGDGLVEIAREHEVCLAIAIQVAHRGPPRLTRDTEREAGRIEQRRGGRARGTEHERERGRAARVGEGPYTCLSGGGVARRERGRNVDSSLSTSDLRVEPHSDVVWIATATLVLHTVRWKPRGASRSSPR